MAVPENMSLEERIQKSVEEALADLRARVEDDVRSLVRQVVAAAEQDQVAAETHMRANLDERVEQARSKERELVQEDAWRVAEAKAEQHIAAALANAESRAEQRASEQVAAARIGERETEMAGVTRLLDSVRGLDGAASLSEVLDALALAAGREAARAAVLVLRTDRLLGWKLSGFGARDSQPRMVDLAVAESGVLGLAVSAARTVTTRDSDAAFGPSFAELPADRMGLAVPVIVGGRVVAIVYADGVTEAEHLVPSGWPEIVEILARHAARCLEALTVQKSVSASPSPRFWVPPSGKVGTSPPRDAASSPPAPDQPRGPGSEAFVSDASDAGIADGPEAAARRCARLLLSEIRLYHEPAVDEGRRSRNLLSRLGPEIERARRLYEANVPASVRTRAELFHQELVATLAGGDPGLLGAPA